MFAALGMWPPVSPIFPRDLPIYVLCPDCVCRAAHSSRYCSQSEHQWIDQSSSSADSAPILSARSKSNHSKLRSQLGAQTSMRWHSVWALALAATLTHGQRTRQNGSVIDPYRIDLAQRAPDFDPARPISLRNLPTSAGDPISQFPRPLPGEDRPGGSKPGQAYQRRNYQVRLLRGPGTQPALPGGGPDCGLWLHNAVLRNVDLVLEARSDGSYRAHALSREERAAAAPGKSAVLRELPLHNLRPALGILLPLRTPRQRSTEPRRRFCTRAGRHARQKLQKLTRPTSVQGPALGGALGGASAVTLATVAAARVAARRRARGRAPATQELARLSPRPLSDAPGPERVPPAGARRPPPPGFRTGPWAQFQVLHDRWAAPGEAHVPSYRPPGPSSRPSSEPERQESAGLKSGGRRKQYKPLLEGAKAPPETHVPNQRPSGSSSRLPPEPERQGSAGVRASGRGNQYQILPEGGEAPAEAHASSYWSARSSSKLSSEPERQGSPGFSERYQALREGMAAAQVPSHRSSGSSSKPPSEPERPGSGRGKQDQALREGSEAPAETHLPGHRSSGSSSGPSSGPKRPGSAGSRANGHGSHEPAIERID